MFYFIVVINYWNSSFWRGLLYCWCGGNCRRKANKRKWQVEQANPMGIFLLFFCSFTFVLCNKQSLEGKGDIAFPFAVSRKHQPVCMSWLKYHCCVSPSFGFGERGSICSSRMHRTLSVSICYSISYNLDLFSITAFTTECGSRSHREETTQSVEIKAKRVRKPHWWGSPHLRDL